MRPGPDEHIHVSILSNVCLRILSLCHVTCMIIIAYTYLYNIHSYRLFFRNYSQWIIYTHTHARTLCNLNFWRGRSGVDARL